MFPSRPGRCVLLGLAWLGAGAGVPVRAQAPEARASLVGIVLDERSGDPVVGAQVAVLGTDFRGTSNGDGEFIFPDLPAGPRSLRFAHPGYGTIVAEVDLAPDGVADVRVDLPPVAVVLEELLVRAGRPRPAALAGEVRPDRVQGFTAADLLAAHVPGLTMGVDRGLAGRGASVTIRGTGSITQSDAPLIYLDGILVADFVTPSTPSGVQALSVLAQIPAREVASVRVLRGPAAASRYPNAANGVILIETHRGLGQGARPIP